MGSQNLCHHSRTTDTQWRQKSKIFEKLGQCGRQNMLRPYLKIWEWEWIFGCAVKAISSLGVRSLWNRVWLAERIYPRPQHLRIPKEKKKRGCIARIMQAWKKRYLHNPLSFALEWFFSLPSYLLQQNYFLDFTHFNIEELDLTDQRFFWNRNVVNWRRGHFLLWIVCISVCGKVICNFTFSREKKLVMLLPTQRVCFTKK